MNLKSRRTIRGVSNRVQLRVGQVKCRHCDSLSRHHQGVVTQSGDHV
jgi:hypothetical protein